MSFDPEAVAVALNTVRHERRIVVPLSTTIAPATVEQGASAQFALAQLVGAIPPAGFKIGATGKRMQEYLGLSGPAAGFMAMGGLYRSGATLRFSDFVRPGAECELVVRLGRDLPPGPCTPEQAAAAVGE